MSLPLPISISPLPTNSTHFSDEPKDQHAQPSAARADRIPELLADRMDIAQVMMFVQQTAGAGFVFAHGQWLDLDGRQINRAVALMGANALFEHGLKCETLRAICSAPRANSLFFRYLSPRRNFQ
jgi:hypothetical protein